jgi:recombination protein RecT
MFGERGKRIGVYALAKTKDGSIYVEVMTEKQVMDVKNISRSKDFGPWSGPFEEEMYKKTALRRLSKRLPMSTDIEETIRRDDDLFMPESVQEKVVAAKTEPVQRLAPPEEKKMAPSKLKEAIKAKNTKPQDEVIEAESEEADRPAIFANEDNDLDRHLGQEDPI